MPETARGNRGRIEHLEQRHNTLSRQVDELERYRHLTAEQQFQITDLKKKKLATKDAISVLLTGC